MVSGNSSRWSSSMCKTFLSYPHLRPVMEEGCYNILPKLSHSIKTSAIQRYSLPVWPDLAKFRHFGNILWIFVKWLRVYSVFGNFFNLLWLKCKSVFGQPFNVAHGQTLKNNVAIWSHCCGPQHNVASFSILVNYSKLRMVNTCLTYLPRYNTLR